MKKIKKTKYLNFVHARTKSQKKLMEKMMRDGACPFCFGNLERYHKPPILKFGKSWLVTSNMYPYKGARVHLLFIHRAHIENISGVNAKDWKEFARHIRWAENYFKIKGGSFLMRFGDSDFTGGTISHLHAQIVSGARRRKNNIKQQSINTRIGYQKN